MQGTRTWVQIFSSQKRLSAIYLEPRHWGARGRRCLSSLASSGPVRALVSNIKSILGWLSHGSLCASASLRLPLLPSWHWPSQSASLCASAGRGPHSQSLTCTGAIEGHTILLPVEGHTSLTSEGIRDRVPCLGMPRLAQETLSHLAFSTDLGSDSLGLL